ncbi:kinase-regulated stress-responsive transcription factor skn7 [Blyttiomyces sp. JEL0837]|nr:kinase-regulated stress-responsive transcription factor skn7 [Blyttiomyces sp. JEL0837]
MTTISNNNGNSNVLQFMKAPPPPSAISPPAITLPRASHPRGLGESTESNNSSSGDLPGAVAVAAGSPPPPTQPQSSRYQSSTNATQQQQQLQQSPTSKSGSLSLASPSPATMGGILVRQSSVNSISGVGGVSGNGVPPGMAVAVSVANQSVFINKLYTMLEEANQSLICWDSSGTYFIVHNPTDFAKNILPLYFKHNNFASFVRQLNMYGFHKINDSFFKLANSSEVWEFKHQDFRRGEIHLLQKIKRKAPSKSSSKSQAASTAAENSDGAARPPPINTHQGIGMGGDVHGHMSSHIGGFSGANDAASRIGGNNGNMISNNSHGYGSQAGIHGSHGYNNVSVPARGLTGLENLSKEEKVEVLSHRVMELEEKLAKLHESYNLLWSETVACRLLQSKHHMIITNMTSFLASIYREDNDRKRKFDVDILQAEVAKISPTSYGSNDQAYMPPSPTSTITPVSARPSPYQIPQIPSHQPQQTSVMASAEGVDTRSGQRMKRMKPR